MCFRMLLHIWRSEQNIRIGERLANMQTQMELQRNRSELDLQHAIEKCTSRKLELESLIHSTQKEVRKYLLQKKKEDATFHVKRKDLFQQAVRKCVNVLLQLESMKLTLKQGDLNRHVLGSMRNVVNVLKLDSEATQNSADVMDDLASLIADAEDVDHVLSHPLQEINEDDVADMLAEEERLLQTESFSSSSYPLTATTHAVVSPTAPVKDSKVIASSSSSSSSSSSCNNNNNNNKIVAIETFRTEPKNTTNKDKDKDEDDDDEDTITDRFIKGKQETESLESLLN